MLNSLMEVTAAGGAIGIPGLYVTGDPGGVDEAAKVGSLSLRLGLGWAKSQSFTTGQCPVMKYNRELMMAILHDRVQIAKAVNATADLASTRPRRATPTSTRARPRSTSSTRTAWSRSRSKARSQAPPATTRSGAGHGYRSVACSCYRPVHRVEGRGERCGMGHYRSNLRDVEFVLFELLGADRSLGQGPFSQLDRDSARDVLREVERLATYELAAAFAASDRDPPRMGPRAAPRCSGVAQALHHGGLLRRGLAHVRIAEHSRRGGGAALAVWVAYEMTAGANPAVYFYGFMGTSSSSIIEAPTPPKSATPST